MPENVELNTFLFVGKVRIAVLVSSVKNVSLQPRHGPIVNRRLCSFTKKQYLLDLTFFFYVDGNFVYGLVTDQISNTVQSVE